MADLRVRVVPDAVARVDRTPGEVGLFVRVEEAVREAADPVEQVAAHRTRAAEKGCDLGRTRRIARAQPRHMTACARAAGGIPDPQRDDAQPLISGERAAEV